MPSDEHLVREIFEREIGQAGSDQEPSPFIDWMGRLRDEILDVMSRP